MLHTYIYHSTTLRVTYLPDIELTVMSVNCLQYSCMLNIYRKCFAWSSSGRKNVPRPDRSDIVPARNSTNTCSRTISISLLARATVASSSCCYTAILLSVMVEASQPIGNLF